MPAARIQDSRLVQLSRICLAYPEVVRALRLGPADFRVRKKAFAYFLNNHHGGGIVSVCVRSSLGENLDRVSSRPDLFYLPAYLGPRGWFGMRLDRDVIDWGEVENIVRLSYLLGAPRSLSRSLEEQPGQAG
jgi:hypothetical protein